MTEKPFVHKHAFKDQITNFMFHEDLVKILPYLIKETGIINVGGKARSVYSFAKIHNKNVKKTKQKNNTKLPLKQTMNLAKLKKIYSKIK